MLRVVMDLLLRPFTNVSGRYEVERALGRSGAGELWVARDRGEGRSVVLEAIAMPKVVPDAVASFVREVTTGRPPSTGGIAEVLAAGADEALGILWVAYAPFEGESLRMRLARGVPPPRETLAVIGRVLDALAPAHAAGLVHRGLDPDDVWLVREVDGKEGVRIVDFGFARHLAAPERSPYVSPEQARQSGWITPAADTYSVGVLFYELVAGAPPPVDGPAPPLTQVAPGTPAPIAELIARAMSIDPGLRPPNARAMALAVERVFAPPPAVDAAASGSTRRAYFGHAGGYGPGGGPLAAGPTGAFSAGSVHGAHLGSAARRGPGVAPTAPTRRPSVTPWVVGLVLLLGGCFVAPLLLLAVAWAFFAFVEPEPAPPSSGVSDDFGAYEDFDD
jgi:serine/threonine-protein kinase